MVATVGPGVRNAEVKAAAAEAGLWYPPDPSSFEICSIGGNLATNAGGLCCVKYGVTTDYVLGIQVVLADGRAVRLGGRTIKDVAGYDLKRLFVGSEGTLGIITEATLRLRPPPPPFATVVATFASVTDAGRAVVDVVGRVRPAALELMDRAAVAAVEQVRPSGLDLAAAALLLARTDGDPAEADLVQAACTDAGATYVARTDDPDEGELLMGARRMAIPCVERQGTVLIEDVGVPVPRIPELLAAVEATAARHRTSIPVIGHAGDGNFHPLVTYDATDPDATARAHAAFDEVMASAIALGGTISGEHGIGVLKARHLRAQVGEDVMDLTRRIKARSTPTGSSTPASGSEDQAKRRRRASREMPPRVTRARPKVTTGTRSEPVRGRATPPPDTAAGGRSWWWWWSGLGWWWSWGSTTVVVVSGTAASWWWCVVVVWWWCVVEGGATGVIVSVTVAISITTAFGATRSSTRTAR